jgi:hypothetical protein
MGVAKLSTDERHSNWRGPVPLRPTPKLSEGLLNVNPDAAVMVNSKYLVGSSVPPMVPLFVEPVPQPVARKLFELLEFVTPFLVIALMLRFEMADPLYASEVVFPVVPLNE